MLLLKTLVFIYITLLKIMAFRSMNQWQRMVNGLRGYATSTPPKMKAYNPTVNLTEQHSSKKFKGDFVPVYVAVGMITLSVTLGLLTAKQHLMYNPQVFVRKEKRETLPEVLEPDNVLDETEKFMKKSFFRKVAHVQEFHNPLNADPTRGDNFAVPPRAVTLKDAGVDPKEIAKN